MTRSPDGDTDGPHGSRSCNAWCQGEEHVEVHYLPCGYDTALERVHRHAQHLSRLLMRPGMRVLRVRPAPEAPTWGERYGLPPYPWATPCAYSVVYDMGGAI